MEFVAVEFFAVLPYPAVVEEYMAVVADGAGDGDAQQYGADEQAAAYRGYEVEGALIDAVPTSREVVSQGEHHDLFVVEHLRLYAAHGCTDEIGDE